MLTKKLTIALFALPLLSSSVYGMEGHAKAMIPTREHIVRILPSDPWEAFKTSCNWIATDHPLYGLVVSDTAETHIKTLLEDFKKATMKNVVISGPRGTGKTALATAIAYSTYRSHLLNAGALLTQDTEEVQKTLVKILTDLNDDRYDDFSRGLLILDNAELILGTEAATQGREQLISLLTAAINSTDRKFHFIAVTRDHNSLKYLTRFELVQLDLPAKEERKKIIKSWIFKCFFSNIGEFANEITLEKDCFSPDLTGLVAKTEGWSGEEIKELVHQIGKKARLEGKTKITRDIVELVIATAEREQKPYTVHF